LHITEHSRQRNTISERITGSALLHGFPVVTSELATNPTEIAANRLPFRDKMAVALFGDRAVNVSIFEPRGKLPDFHYLERFTYSSWKSPSLFALGLSF
jgi:hypothetical protein